MRDDYEGGPSQALTSILVEPRAKRVRGARLLAPERTPTYRFGGQLDAFLKAHNDSVIGTSHVINPLLDLWKSVHDESEAAASPIEKMLTALVRRNHTSHKELARMVDEVIKAAP